jgi:hypothetical protein
LVSLVGALGFVLPAIVSAEGPDISRCTEYLFPFSQTEWDRCIGDEFGKFPDASPVLKDAYTNAPLSGQWPGAQRIYLGENAPYVDLPHTDRADSGYVYVPPSDSNAEVPRVLTNQTPIFDGSWWQQPASQALEAPLIEAPKTDLYSAWQNYWMSDGLTGYGGWGVRGGYTVPPW